MKVQDIKTFSNLVIFISSGIRGIIAFPFRLIGLIIGFPNVKIVFKSGHVEYYFFVNIKIESNSGKITGIQWEVSGAKTPTHIGINEIESIHRIW